MTLNNVVQANGIVINSGSRITFSYPGTYNIQFSAQLHNTGGGGSGHTIDIWYAYNGTDVAWSDTRVDVISNSPYVVAAWNFFQTVSAGDYIELKWATDNTNIVIEASAASSPHPAIPSLIVTVQQIMYTQVAP
jgi:hypothetical protein